ERFLLSLVDDAHAAMADDADDAVLAQAIQRAAVGGNLRPLELAGGVGGRLELFDLEQGGEQVADVGGQVRIAVGVLAQGGTLTSAVARDELRGQSLQQHIAGRIRGGHATSPQSQEKNSGTTSRRTNRVTVSTCCCSLRVRTGSHWLC